VLARLREQFSALRRRRCAGDAQASVVHDTVRMEGLTARSPANAAQDGADRHPGSFRQDAKLVAALQAADHTES
jgi:hypothetical protein